MSEPRESGSNTTCRERASTPERGSGVLRLAWGIQRSLRTPFASLAPLASRMVEAPGFAPIQRRLRNSLRVALFLVKLLMGTTFDVFIDSSRLHRVLRNPPHSWSHFGGDGKGLPAPGPEPTLVTAARSIP